MGAEAEGARRAFPRAAHEDPLGKLQSAQAQHPSQHRAGPQTPGMPGIPGGARDGAPAGADP